MTHVRRGELRLARAPAYALGHPGPETDPLSAFAQVMGLVDERLNEDVVVHFDLLPVTPSRRHGVRRGLLKSVREKTKPRGPAGSGLGNKFFDDMRSELTRGTALGNGAGRGRGRQVPIEVVEQRRGVRELDKLVASEAMFEMQILLRVQSDRRDRANELFRSLLAAFSQFDGDNELRLSGLRLGSVDFVGSDVPVRRQWFDYRERIQYFRPAHGHGKKNVVNASEIWGLLKPPSARCPERNIVRSGPYVGPAPKTLPEYVGQRGVIPLGMAKRDGDEHEVMVGMNADQFFFGLTTGMSRWGKTEKELVAMLHIALRERAGVLFLDPHVDATVRVAPYLTEPGVRERVVDLNLSRQSETDRHVSWNLMSMQGLGAGRIADRADAIISAVLTISGYTSKSAPRSTAMLKASVYGLLTLARELPADRQPTIFTIPTMLRDDAWRAAAVARLPEHMQRYWHHEFAGYPIDAPSPLCQLFETMALNPVVRATFGAPVSSYDPREAMDSHRIILAAPPSPDDRLVYSLILQGHMAAGLSRTDMTPEERARHLFYVWLDEAQICDAESDSPIPKIVEQFAKFGWRSTEMLQGALRLQVKTRRAITTNASALITTAADAEGAKFYKDQWGGFDAYQAVLRLPKYNYIAQVTHEERRCDPFRLRGLPLEEVYAEHRHPDRLAELEAAIDASCRPRTVRETLKLIDGEGTGTSHDDRILHALRNAAKAQRASNGNGTAPVVVAPALGDLPRVGFSVRPAMPSTEDAEEG